MQIRRLLLDDYHKGYISLLNILTPASKTTLSFEVFKEKFDIIRKYSDIQHIFVIEDKEKIIATVTLLIEEKFIHGCNRVGHIEDLVVSEDYQGCGIGTLITKYVIDYAYENRCYKVILNCSEPKKEFYAKLGFNQKNIQMSHYF